MPHHPVANICVMLSLKPAVTMQAHHKVRGPQLPSAISLPFPLDLMSVLIILVVPISISSLASLLQVSKARKRNRGCECTAYPFSSCPSHLSFQIIACRDFTHISVELN